MLAFRLELLPGYLKELSLDSTRLDLSPDFGPRSIPGHKVLQIAGPTLIHISGRDLGTCISSLPRVSCTHTLLLCSHRLRLFRRQAANVRQRPGQRCNTSSLASGHLEMATINEERFGAGKAELPELAPRAVPQVAPGR